MHVGDGFLDDGLPGFEAAVERLAAVAQRLIDAGCPIGEINTGGGLGLPQAPGERPLDLDAYAAAYWRGTSRRWAWSSAASRATSLSRIRRSCCAR